MRPNYFSAIRLPANNVLREKIALRLTRPMGYLRKQGKTLLRGLLVPGGILGLRAPCNCQDRMASGLAVPARGLNSPQQAKEPDWVVRFYS